MNGANKYLSEEEIKHIRALYAAKVTMVDRWFGHFMEKFHNMGLEKDTAVLFITDHGVGLGEHGVWKKTPLVLYHELLDGPMMLMVPGAAPGNRRIPDFIQEYDIAPTLLNLLGQEVPGSMNGHDFSSRIKGGEGKPREYVVGGYHTHAYVRDDRHHYFRSLKEGDEAPHLFDLKGDPRMDMNIAGEVPEITKMMEERLIKELDGWTLPKTLGTSVAQQSYEPLGKKRL
jgi:arylsulfatase A-like enzyme